jgi:hypothetical protein
MAIKVRLRIVGLYFNTTVKINDNINLTVRDVMDEYIRLNPNISVVGGLEYVRYPKTGGSDDFVRTLTYHFGGKYDFNGDGDTNDAVDGKSLGNKTIAKGIYTLSEDLEDGIPGYQAGNKVGLAWQYYVVGANGKVKSATPASRQFSSFGKVSPDYDIEDGDTIIWRLVAIARKPNYQDV